jgi:hypothetical protein
MNHPATEYGGCDHEEVVQDGPEVVDVKIV